jgi:hypothetical protein
MVPTISQSIAYTFAFIFSGEDNKDSWGASGVSTHPGGFWNKSAIYDGMG